MSDLIAPGCLVDVGNLTEEDVGPAGCPQQEIANFRDVVAIVRIECDDDVENAISFISLADDVTLVRGTDDIEDIDDIETPAFKILLPQPDGQLRHSGRRLQLHFRGALNATDRPRNVACHEVEPVKVIAKDVDNDRCRVPGQDLFDSLRKERFEDKADPWELDQRSAQFGLRLFDLIPRQTGLEGDFELAVMRAPAIASPPRVMALSVTPNAVRTITALRSESGIAMQQIAAVRRSNRNRNRTMTTRIPPRNKESRTLVVAVSMKSAGRKRSA